MDATERFCLVIDKYCNSLAFLLEDIRLSTIKSTEILQDREYRSGSFDSYVMIIENFNSILYSTAKQIKQIISCLTSIFVNKSIDSLIDFFQAINSLLIYLVKEDVFLKFNKLKQLVDRQINDKLDMIDKIDKVRNIIFNIFNITITITAIFIPTISPLIPAIHGLETLAESKIETMRANVESHNIEIERIVRRLLNIQGRSEILENINSDSIYKCLHDKEADELMVRVEQMYEGYDEILILMFNLDNEIANYFKKKRSRFSFCRCGVF